MAILKIFIRFGLVIGFTGPALADTSWSIVRDFGLAGTWAYFCNRPASRVNYFETYADGPNGTVRRDVNRGIELPKATSILSDAQIVGPATLKARILNSDQNWGSLNNFSYDIILTKEEDPTTNEVIRIRFIEAIRSDGKVMAKNARYPCPLRSKPEILVPSRCFPLLTQKRRLRGQVAMSPSGQQQTRALQQITSLFDHLVGTGEQQSRKL